MRILNIALCIIAINGCTGAFENSSLKNEEDSLGCKLMVVPHGDYVDMIELCDGHQILYDYRIADIQRDSNYRNLVADRKLSTEMLLKTIADSSLVPSRKGFGRSKGMLAFEILEAIYEFNIYQISGHKSHDVVAKCGRSLFSETTLMSNPVMYSDMIRKWIDTHYVSVETKRGQYPVITLEIGEEPHSIKYTYDPLYDRIVKDSLYYNVVQNKGAWSDLLLSSIADTSQVVVHYINGPLPRSQGVMNYDLVMAVLGVDCFEVFDAKSELSDICECQNKRPLEFLIRFHPAAINGVVEKLQRYIEKQ